MYPLQLLPRIQCNFRYLNQFLRVSEEAATDFPGTDFPPFISLLQNVYRYELVDQLFVIVLLRLYVHSIPKQILYYRQDFQEIGNGSISSVPIGFTLRLKANCLVQ